jgi:hypothetical protein
MHVLDTTCWVLTPVAPKHSDSRMHAGLLLEGLSLTA